LGNVQTQIKKKPFSVMKNLLLAFVLLFPFLSIAQNTQVFEVHEVDSVAIPRGGYSYLTTFINANLQIPYMAKVAKVNGYVSLAGIVDEQGKISQIEVIKGIRSDCDKEAVRVFGLFNAWQAALKGGKAVKQKISFRIPFKSTEEIVFVDGVQITYFDQDSLLTNNPDSYRYVLKTYIDTLSGYPIDDINPMKFYDLKNDKEMLLSSFIQKKWKPIIYNPSYPEKPTEITQTYYNVSYLNSHVKLLDNALTLFWDGALFKKQTTFKGKYSYPLIEYYRNGAVRAYTDYIDEKREIYQKTSWYPDGQIASIAKYEKGFLNQPENLVNSKSTTITPPSNVSSFAETSRLASTNQITIESIINQWDKDGQQTVINGEGIANFRTYYGEKYQVTNESGKITKFKRDGVWYKRNEDGLLDYKEYYNNGVFDRGVSFNAIGDSVVYRGEQQAEYNGGMKAFAKFLQKNLTYPQNAQIKRAQGKAYIQFVIGTDGSVNDLSILKSTGNLDLDDEAMRVVKLSGGQWVAGVQRGRKVRSRFTIPINFNL
jgi:TonB family protein